MTSHDQLAKDLLVNLRGGRPGVHEKVLHEGFKPETARFRYQAFSLSGCQADDYLAQAEPLAWALAALMRPGKWSPAQQKIECMRRIAAAELSGTRRWLLGNWVQTYLQLTGRDAAEYERLRDLTANREVKAMEMTWAEQMEAEYTRKGLEKGLEKGMQQGMQQGMEKGLAQGLERGKVEALRRIVLRQLGLRFGVVPEPVRQKVEAIDEAERLETLAEKILVARSIEEMGLS